MRSVLEFVKTTVIGGVVVILPVGVTVLLTAKTLVAILGLLQPLTGRLPVPVQAHGLAAVLIIVAVCFLAGAVVRTRPGRRAQEVLDRNLLERIPGYTLVRGLTGRIAGRDEGQLFAAALVEIEEALVPAFIVEEHPDGRYTVFVPSVPTPAAGTVYILTPERVHLVDVPFTKAVKVITQWGVGSREMLAAMRPPQAVGGPRGAT